MLSREEFMRVVGIIVRRVILAAVAGGVIAFIFFRLHGG